MTALMIGVLMLEYELVRVLASDLASAPKLGRPAPGEKGTLNALLPPAFFKYQDALVERSRTLAASATGSDDERMVAAFASVTQTCVGCHSAYLHDELEVPDVEHPATPEPCDPGDSCDAAAGASAKSPASTPL